MKEFQFGSVDTDPTSIKGWHRIASDGGLVWEGWKRLRFIANADSEKPILRTSQ